MKRSLLASLLFIVLSFGSFFGLVLYTISDTPTDALIVHAIDEEASWVPGYTGMARWYLTSQRIPDIPDGELCHGLHYTLSGIATDATWEVADAFIEAGADVNCTETLSGLEYPLLHLMIIQADEAKVDYVLGQGADTTVTIGRDEEVPDPKRLTGLDALEWTQFLSLQRPEQIKTYQSISRKLQEARAAAP